MASPSPSDLPPGASDASRLRADRLYGLPGLPRRLRTWTGCRYVPFLPPAARQEDRDDGKLPQPDRVARRHEDNCIPDSADMLSDDDDMRSLQSAKNDRKT